MTGTPPKDMRFALRAGPNDGGVKVLIPFPGPVSFSVYANDVRVEPNPFDDLLGKPAPVAKTACGQSAYFARANYLDFYITPGCVVELRQRDAIQSSVRIEWTLDEFYADGGTSRFTDRLASVLGIPASRIRVLQVYEGSVIISTEIVENEPEAINVPVDPENPVEPPPEDLTEIKTDLQVKVLEPPVNAQDPPVLGAPVIGLIVDTVVEVGTVPDPPYYDPKIDGLPPNPFNDLEEEDVDTTKTELEGNDEDDELIGTLEEDYYIFGRDGDDVIVGNSGADEILGGEGKDEINGKEGDD